MSIFFELAFNFFFHLFLIALFIQIIALLMAISVRNLLLLLLSSMIKYLFPDFLAI